MNQQKDRGALVVGMLVVVLMFTLLAFPWAVQAAGKPIQLKVISAWAQNNKMNDALWILQKKVTGGRVCLDREQGFISGNLLCLEFILHPVSAL